MMLLLRDTQPQVRKLWRRLCRCVTFEIAGRCAVLAGSAAGRTHSCVPRRSTKALLRVSPSYAHGVSDRRGAAWNHSRELSAAVA
jgi:hypothetical protein